MKLFKVCICALVLVSHSLYADGLPSISEKSDQPNATVAVESNSKPTLPSWSEAEKGDYYLSHEFLKATSEIIGICDKKKNFEQWVAIGCQKRFLRHVEHSEKRQKQVTTEIKQIASTDENIQGNSSALQAIAANEQAHTYNIKIEFTFVDKICLKLAKFRAKADKRNEFMYTRQCEKGLKKGVKKKTKKRCNKALSAALNYFMGAKKADGTRDKAKSFYNQINKPMYPEVREAYIKKSKEIIYKSVERACDDNPFKTRSARVNCRQLFDEIEENRVECRTKGQVEKVSMGNTVNVLLNFFIESAIAGEDKVTGKDVVTDYVKGTKETILKYESAPAHRYAVYEALENNYDISGNGHNKARQTSDYESYVATEQANKWNQMNNKSLGLKLPLLGRDYKSDGAPGDLKDFMRLDAQQAQELNETAKSLSPFGFGGGDLKTFVSDIYKSAYAPKFPDPKIEGRLNKNAQLLDKAMASARRVMDEEDKKVFDPKELAFMKSKERAINLAFAKSLNKRTPSDVKSALLSRAGNKVRNSAINDLKNPNEDMAIAYAPSKGSASRDSFFKGGKGSMTEDGASSSEFSGEDGLDDEEVEVEEDPYGFSLSSDPETDKELKEKLLAQKSDEPGESGISTERGENLFVRITNRYKKSYKYLVKTRKKSKKARASR